MLKCFSRRILFFFAGGGEELGFSGFGVEEAGDGVEFAEV